MATKAARGFADPPCPKCGGCGDVAVRLDDLDSFYCNSCSEESGRADVEAMIAAWQRCFAWLDSAPEK